MQCEDITKKGLNYHRKHNISLVFQNYNLIDYLTTVENVKLGGSGNAEKLLEEVGIGKEYWQRNVLQLSGGQQQRVAIARALASDAHVLLADEPAAEIVRKIFHLSIRFLATYSEERRQKASEYAKKHGLNSQQS